MHFPNRIEELCYEPSHIDRVTAEIRANFPDYFQQYLDSEAGATRIVTQLDISKIAAAIGASEPPKAKKRFTDPAIALRGIVSRAIEDFEKDQKVYVDIFDLSAFDDYETDKNGFFKQKVLRNECPIIRKTLKNEKAKELDKYRVDFSIADAGDLFEKVKNIIIFAHNYSKIHYDAETFEQVEQVQNMGFSELDTEDYIVWGVIGGGIRSHFLYKLFPAIFPYRSQEALWAMWYLTNKKAFDCRQDSEFLMINIQENNTQQNFFYPYDLFAWYALCIFQLIKKELGKAGLSVPIAHRFVLVNSFLQFVARQHNDEIADLKKKIKEDKNGY